MRKTRKGALLLTFLTVVLALTLVAARLPVADQGGRVLRAALSGANEVPPADPDGSGTAVLTFNPGQETICWWITASDITLPATAAHIHDGPAGVAGPVVVTLSAPDESGTSSGCTTADRDLILEILHDPGDYYVNVHNADYPGGAIRGQLSK